MREKKLKICKFVEGSFIPAMDGASQKFSNIVHSLEANNVEVIIIHCYRGWSDLKQISREKFKTYAIPADYYYFKNELVKKIIEQEKPDLIEMNDPELINSQGVILNSLYKIPIIYDLHFISSQLESRISGKNNEITTILEKRLASLLSGVIAFTKEDKKEFIRITGINASRVKIIPLGVNTKVIKPRKISPKDSTILFLGNMFFEPNYRAMKTIIEEISPEIIQLNPNIKFKFVGDCPKEIIKKYSNKNFIFEGRIMDINEVFRGVRVCIAPILIGGGMRVKTLTYMAAGLPIIATTAAVEGIKHQGSILVTDDINDFSHNVNQLLADYNKSVELGEKARKICSMNYDWNSISQKCIKFYKECLRKNKIDSDIIPLLIKRQPFWLEELIKKGRFKEQKLENSLYYILGKRRFKTVVIGKPE